VYPTRIKFYYSTNFNNRFVICGMSEGLKANKFEEAQRLLREGDKWFVINAKPKSKLCTLSKNINVGTKTCSRKATQSCLRDAIWTHGNFLPVKIIKIISSLLNGFFLRSIILVVHCSQQSMLLLVVSAHEKGFVILAKTKLWVNEHSFWNRSKPRLGLTPCRFCDGSSQMRHPNDREKPVTYCERCKNIKTPAVIRRPKFFVEPKIVGQPENLRQAYFLFFTTRGMQSEPIKCSSFSLTLTSTCRNFVRSSLRFSTVVAFSPLGSDCVPCSRGEK